jgi:hypothetical protein
MPQNVTLFGNRVIADVINKKRSACRRWPSPTVTDVLLKGKDGLKKHMEVVVIYTKGEACNRFCSHSYKEPALHLGLRPREL